MVKVIGVLAVDSAYGIGLNGKLLPFPREDMLHFHETVKDQLILCTSSTYKQMKKSLGRFFVYSRRPVYYVSAESACSSARYLLNKTKREAKKDNKDVYLCGGTRLYELLRHEVNEWIITVDEATYESDAKLPWVKDLLHSDKYVSEKIKQLTPTVAVYRVTNVNND